MGMSWQWLSKVREYMKGRHDDIHIHQEIEINEEHG
jgi:hypothetical protein